MRKVCAAILSAAICLVVSGAPSWASEHQSTLSAGYLHASTNVPGSDDLNGINVKYRIRVLYLAVIRLLKISHTILHLQCAEGASTERSLELFRAYDYTPRIAELLAIRFLVSPGNLLRRQT